MKNDMIQNQTAKLGQILSYFNVIHIFSHRFPMRIYQLGNKKSKVWPRISSKSSILWSVMKHLSLYVLLVSIFLRVGDSQAKNFSDTEFNSLLLDFTKQLPSQQLINLVWTTEGLIQLNKNQEGLFLSVPQEIALDQPGQFQTFATSLKVANYDPTNLYLSVRFSEDENEWGDWEELAPNHEGIVTDTSMTSELLYLPQSIRYFQLRVEYSAFFSGLPAAKIQSVQIDFFSPGTMPPIDPSQVGYHTLPGTNDACVCPLPPFATRTDWNSPDGQDPSCSSPAYSTVTHQIVHHSFTSNTSGNWAATVLSIWNYHVNSNGWCDIGYNWLIAPDGVIYEGRGGGNNVRGAHFCATNTGTMGICMLGTYMDTVPTAAALESLKQLLTWKSCDVGIDPTATSFHSASGKNLPEISGHRDGCNTLCPGNALFAELPSIREDVALLVAECDSFVTAIDEEFLPQIEIFPNPTTDFFSVRWEAPLSEKTDFHLLSPLGDVVYRQEEFVHSGPNTLRFQLPTLARGIYYLQVYSSRGIVSKKILLGR